MTRDAVQAQQIGDALKLEEIELPENPRVIGLRWNYYEDASGEESLRIWMILADETADEEITGQAVHAIRWEVRKQLEAAGIRLFPYFTFARKSGRNKGEPPHFRFEPPPERSIHLCGLCSARRTS